MGKAKEERSFSDHLKHVKKGNPANSIATLCVEGFHAAQTDRISILGLNKVNGAAEQIEGHKQFRFAAGYHTVVQLLHDEAVEHSAQFHLNALVREVRWKRNSVAVVASTPDGTLDLHAKSIIVTAPLGVLQAKPDEVPAIR